MRCRFFAFILVLLAIGSVAQAAPPVHVKATLLADVKQIVPGKPFHLGVLVEIDPGWHIYWLNPGDSGMATKITLDLPKGLTAGDVQFPTPIKIVDPGNINIFGYTDRVMFISTVTPDKSLAAGEADLSAKVSYLVCKDICVPGKATPTLNLAIAAVGQAVQPANMPAFAAWEAQLPALVEDSPSIDHFSQRYDVHSQTVSIAFHFKGILGLPSVFPGPTENVNISSQVMVTFAGLPNTGGCYITLRITPLAGQNMPSATLPVVIGWATPGHERRGVITQIDLDRLKRVHADAEH